MKNSIHLSFDISFYAIVKSFRRSSRYLTKVICVLIPQKETLKTPALFWYWSSSPSKPILSVYVCLLIIVSLYQQFYFSIFPSYFIYFTGKWWRVNGKEMKIKGFFMNICSLFCKLRHKNLFHLKWWRIDVS